MKTPNRAVDFKDPFNAGQMVGMLVMLSFLEKNKSITEEMLNELKRVTANNVQEYFDKPTEDIHLMIEDLMKGIE